MSEGGSLMGHTSLLVTTVEEPILIKCHLHVWAWYTSNVGQLLPHFNDIQPEEGEEPLPASNRGEQVSYLA